ncbi:hypothetical protein EVAR_37330_1 [Eumeta japonica]|uniref:Uncharacterized protein n=1 Tax=Eumeta variegata TaxID=151549 RepID=A0A4C1X1R9_EUMVA|nr:hypothetical protein EVAR_37330_1 [Eumeta japonica]
MSSHSSIWRGSAPGRRPGAAFATSAPPPRARTPALDSAGCITCAHAMHTHPIPFLAYVYDTGCDFSWRCGHPQSVRPLRPSSAAYRAKGIHTNVISLSVFGITKLQAGSVSRPAVRLRSRNLVTAKRYDVLPETKNEIVSETHVDYLRHNVQSRALGTKERITFNILNIKRAERVSVQFVFVTLCPYRSRSVLPKFESLPTDGAARALAAVSRKALYCRAASNSANQCFTSVLNS